MTSRYRSFHCDLIVPSGAAHNCGRKSNGSPHDDEFPWSVRDSIEPPSQAKVPFGIDNGVLVNELRQLADAVEAKEVFPQEFVRTQRDLFGDFKMFTLSVTFGSPAASAEPQQ